MRTQPASTPHTDTRADLGALRALTVNHRTAGFTVLERVALPLRDQDALAASLVEAGLESVLLCTCNRTELYWHSRGGDDDAFAEKALASAVARRALPETGFARSEGLLAAAHLFRVAAGLESMVLGEAEVLGQVREAIERADGSGAVGALLSPLFRAALRFGGRARAETRIGQGALSVASAAVRRLAGSHTDLSACTIVVIGAGVTGVKAARHLKSERVGRLVLLNRTLERAQGAAADLGAEAGSLADLPGWLSRADAVIAAAHVAEPLVTVEMLRTARSGHGAPLTLVDLSLPHAIDPGCAAIEDVSLFDLSGLERVVSDNRALREREIPEVERLLRRELGFFESRMRRTAGGPVGASEPGSRTEEPA